MIDKAQAYLRNVLDMAKWLIKAEQDLGVAMYLEITSGQITQSGQTDSERGCPKYIYIYIGNFEFSFFVAYVKLKIENGSRAIDIRTYLAHGHCHTVCHTLGHMPRW